MEFTIDGGQTGIDVSGLGVAYVELPYGIVFNAWRVIGDATGSCVIDILAGTFADLPLATANSIAGSEKPTLSGTLKAEDTNLSSWSLTASGGKWIGCLPNSASGLRRITVAITGTRL